MYNRLPNHRPPLLPMPEACKFHYEERARYSSCGCRQWALMFCQSKDTAKYLWSSQHMGADPGPVLDEDAA
jgi:hypothetical protein